MRPIEFLGIFGGAAVGWGALAALRFAIIAIAAHLGAA